MKPLHKPIACVALLLAFTATARADGFFDDFGPELKGQIPDRITEGNLVPIIIEGNRFDDKVTRISVDLPDNPESMRHAFDVDYAQPHSHVYVSSRVRMESRGASSVVVTLTTLSGKSTVKRLTTIVDNPTDFSDPERLTRIFKGTFQFPTTEIGQRIVKSRSISFGAGHRRINTMIYHPMFPALNGETDYYVNRIRVLGGSEVFATVHPTPAISNNPFLAIDMNSSLAGKGVTVEWSDTRGHTFKQDAD
ncbi:thiosulfate oxidation carrier complex protein SoxZ [Endothiovibrio diazotrophicus]